MDPGPVAGPPVESPDSEERLEVKLDALLEHQGLDPQKIESTLPVKYQKTR